MKRNKLLRVLIIKLSAFGDIIHSLSVIDCIREYAGNRGGDIELHWLVEKKWSPILNGCPGIENIIVANTKGWRKSLLRRSTWKAISDFFSKLREKRYDLVIDINGLLRSALLARLSRANQRVGFSKDSDFCREKHSTYLLDKTFSVPYGHVVDQTVELLEKALDIKVPGPVNPTLPQNDHAAREALKVLSSKGLTPKDFAIIAAGGGWETKLLDEKMIAEFCDRVAGHGIIPVLSWSGTAEKDRAARTSDYARGPVREIGNLPIDVFIEILRLARIVIGPDTGTVHAASAVETPTVSYYGPSSGDYSGPRRPADSIVQISPQCGPCFKRRCDKDLCNNLSIGKVLDAITDSLRKW